MSDRSPRAEQIVVLTVAAVQFINIVDFMMVTPLGPFFATGLGFPKSEIALVAAAYTAAAGVAGLLGSFFLDKFDRRPALAIAMFGLVLGTALGGFAVDLRTLLLTRVVAGFFGGPATSLSMAIVADVVPVDRRGRAMSVVMTAFSVASVLGVPLGLQLAQMGGWRLPFFGLAALGIVVNVAAYLMMPPIRGHLDRPRTQSFGQELLGLVRKRLVLLSWLMTALVMMAGFLVIPNFPAYLTGNLGLSQNAYKWLYMAGGIASFFTLRITGKVVDRYGSFRVGTAASLALVVLFYFYVVNVIPGTPIYAPFVLFMILMNFRNVAYNTLTSRVPEPEERARFQSIQSAVQHTASAIAGAVSAWILVEGPNETIVHMDWVGLLSMALTLLVPVMLLIVERNVRDRPAQAAALSGPTTIGGPSGPPVPPGH